MIYLCFMSLFLLTMYIMYAVRVCGVPWSLSDTYYQLKKRNRSAWLFQAAMALCPQVRTLVIDAPDGGAELAGELRREYGAAALTALDADNSLAGGRYHLLRGKIPADAV